MWTVRSATGFRSIWHWRAVAAVAAAVALSACDRDAAPRPATPPAAPAPAPAPERAAALPDPEAARVPGCDLDPLPLRRPGAKRVVAIGDLHGDLAATRAVLRLAGAIDDQDRWIGGGDLVVVQTGDVLDRGDDEPEIAALLASLPVIRLNGNHELMNAAGDFRYVTADGFTDYGGDKGRARAFLAGGAEARALAAFDVVAIVGDTVFAHGGVLPEHVDYGLERLNLETRCWLAGHGDELPVTVTDENSPVWNRAYGVAPERCDLLEDTLARLGVARMVVGHTPMMGGITSACDGKVWRIDVGLSRAYGGPLQALEIAGGTASVLAGERPAGR